MRTPDDRRRTDPVLALILTNALGGAVVAIFLVGAILFLDIGRLGTLIAASDAPLAPTALLTAGFVITFASLAMGSAIMRIGRDDERGGGSGRPVPIPVRARRRR